MRNTPKTTWLVACLAIACGPSSEEPAGGQAGSGGRGDVGCVQPAFPSDQPDLSLISPPIFTSNASGSRAGQASVDGGQNVDAEVTVNAVTRRVRVELTEAWSLEVVHAEEYETTGDETLSLVLPTDGRVRGRFYMQLTLCALDCDELAVVFDINPDVNSPYERTVLEGGQVLQVDTTCIDFRARPNQGSGTVLVQ